MTSRHFGRCAGTGGDDFELRHCGSSWVLYKNGHQVEVGEAQLALLDLLTERPEATIHREELIRRLWPASVLKGLDQADADLAQRVFRLRKALGDETKKLVVTDRNRGFRLASRVREAGPSVGSSSDPSGSLGLDGTTKLALELASTGEHDRAIESALSALRLLPADSHKQEAQLRLMLASQHRHQGEFHSASREYARAEALLREELGEPEIFFDLLRIRAGQAMVESFLLGGDPRATLQRYRALDRSTRVFADGRPDDADVQARAQLYMLHSKRQQAELRRQMGKYTLAERMFGETFRAYEPSEAEPRAWALLGQAECRRMLGNFDAAESLYDDADSLTKDRRLRTRILRNKAELLRCRGDDPTVILARLETALGREKYLYGKIYHSLLTGCWLLDQGRLEAARLRFEEAAFQSLIDGTPLGIEWYHARLGLAECRRLEGRGDRLQLAIDFGDIAAAYRHRGIKWGLLRADLARSAVTGAPTPTLKGAEGDFAFGDLQECFGRGDARRAVMQNLL